jgi:hypothetical protein
MNRGAKALQVFRRCKKCPFSSGKVPFAFVKNVVQIAFLTHGCCKAISPPLYLDYIVYIYSTVRYLLVLKHAVSSVFIITLEYLLVSKINRSGIFTSIKSTTLSSLLG